MLIIQHSEYCLTKFLLEVIAQSYQTVGLRFYFFSINDSCLRPVTKISGLFNICFRSLVVCLRSSTDCSRCSVSDIHTLRPVVGKFQLLLIPQVRLLHNSCLFHHFAPHSDMKACVTEESRILIMLVTEKHALILW